MYVFFRGYMASRSVEMLNDWRECGSVASQHFGHNATVIYVQLLCQGLKLSVTTL